MRFKEKKEPNSAMGSSNLFAVVVVIFLAFFFMGISHATQFITWDDLNVNSWSRNANSNDNGSQKRVIFVSKDGKGDSKTVQGAIDLVPEKNNQRVKIFIFPGVYRERVWIPKTKPFVSFIGNRSYDTKISWNLRASDRRANGQEIGTYDSASVAIDSDYFCAKGVTFENTAPGAQPGGKGMQAVALRLTGDKTMLFRCKILGSQDTLFDHNGRHLFLKSYIQGSIDFIFGNARSLYQGCTLNSVAASSGAIAASQRTSASEKTGFSFLNSKLRGTGFLYLGRAWGDYARIVYSFCKFESIVIPEGWSDWDHPSRHSTVWFGEYNCSGRGAETRQRAPWSRTLTYEEARPFLDRYYIDGDQWLRL